MAMAKVFRDSLFVALLCVFVNFAHSVSYNDLEKMGIKCPTRIKCTGTRETRPFYERNCECDSDCQKYKDCCVNAPRRSQTTPFTNVMCLQYGQDTQSGIYAVSKCSSSWTGPREVKQKCEGPTDFSDPISAAPVTSTTGAVTYKNLHCAQCNNADMNSLKVFSFFLSCQGLQSMTQDQLMAEIFFKKEENKWGVNRVNAEGRPEFKACIILFELPDYLKGNVRFCRANVISSCSKDWTRQTVKKACEEYMAVVYTRTKAYRNPHCALCNRVTVSQMDCFPDTSSRKRPLSITALIDINDKSNRNPSCPAKEIYDPYFKTCRRLSCAVPGYVIRNGECVPGS